MMKGHNYILSEMDLSRGIILVLFENSTAFDMLNHDFLLQFRESDGDHRSGTQLVIFITW